MCQFHVVDTSIDIAVTDEFERSFGTNGDVAEADTSKSPDEP